MKRSIQKLEKISTLLSQHQTYYTFSKMEEDTSDKYKKGRISASKWLNALTYYYFKKEKSFITEFRETLLQQKKELSSLKDGDYKKGLFDEFNLIEDMIKKILIYMLVSTLAYSDVGTLSKIIDADTVKFGQITCRLSYIDSPESRKNKRLKRIIKPCKGITINTMVSAGKKSTAYLKTQLRIGKKYKYNVIDIDRYKRSVCVIMINNRNTINQQLVKDGFAVPYYKYIPTSKKNTYKKLFKEAKRLQSGLFREYASTMKCLTN